MYERSDPAFVLNPPTGALVRGALVFGAPRGGTSMVAGVLRLLGVDMGKINGVDRLDEMRNALDLQLRAQTFLAETDLPAAIVSYEKALVRPERFIEQLAAFCGLDPSDAQRAASLDFISPERGHGDPDSPGWPRDGAL